MGRVGEFACSVRKEDTVNDQDVIIPAGKTELRGVLSVPDSSLGVVVFVHGSGSSHKSPRNRYVAGVLNEAGVATLLFDLLTEAESMDRANVFDVPLLARRLEQALAWLSTVPEVGGLPIGLFGASTGAAAALWAAAEGTDAAAIVSRGGRPDMAAERLGMVTAPTRLIVGGDDGMVLSLNQNAQEQLRCENDLVIIEGASHLFQEHGALEQAAQSACSWFTRFLKGQAAPRRSSRPEAPTAHAPEDAEGVELFGAGGDQPADVHLREEAQGIEVFENPDIGIPIERAREGPPGEEVLTADASGLASEEDEERRE